MNRNIVRLQIILLQVDFKLQSEEGDTATFIENGEWALIGKKNFHFPEFPLC